MATTESAVPFPEGIAVSSVRALIDRFHGRSPVGATVNKPKSPTPSSTSSEETAHLSLGDSPAPSSPRSPKGPVEGQYLFRAAKAGESPLDFILKLQNQQQEDEEKEKYVTLLRHVKTDEEDDIDRGRGARQTHPEAVQKSDATDVHDGPPVTTEGSTVARLDAHHSTQEPKGFDKNFGNHYSSNVAKDLDLCLDKDFGEHEESSDEESPHGQRYDLQKGQIDKQCSVNSVDSVDIDFSVIEGTPHLNLEVSKQKLQLRRGSLTNRRRPSRSSVRSMSEVELFEDISDSQEFKAQIEQNTPKSAPVNGHLVWPAACKPKPKSDFGAVPSSLQKVQKIKAPPVAPKPTSLQDQASKPSWLASAKLRKSKSVEQSDLEPESGKPDWMQEALAKKRRAAELLGTQNTGNGDTRDAAEGPMAPWMKERLQKRKSAPPDLEPAIQKKNAANAENIAPKTAGTNQKVTGEKSQLPWRHKSGPAVPGNDKVETAKPEARHHSEPQTGKKVLSTQPVSNYDRETTQQNHGHVIYVSPTCKEKEATSAGGKENTHSVTVPMSPKSDSGTDQLSWKAEIVTRKKTKAYVPSVRPEAPLRLGEIPLWKKELAEKNKQRKEHSYTKPTAEVNTGPTLPLWKQELVQRRRRTSGTPAVMTDSQEPEWKRQAEMRRERLAESGLLGEGTAD